MAGMGRLPKDPKIRRRRNKVATRAVVHDAPLAPAGPIEAESTTEPLRQPPLPSRTCASCQELPKKRAAPKRQAQAEQCVVCAGTRVIPWHPLAVGWWNEVWSYPFSQEYLKTDIVGGLYVLADLYDRYWRTGDLDYAKEIRLQEGRLVLDVMARRRAQWELKRPSAPRPQLVPPLAATGTGGSPRPERVDPRAKVLHMEGAGGTRA